MHVRDMRAMKRKGGKKWAAYTLPCLEYYILPARATKLDLEYEQ